MGKYVKAVHVQYGDSTNSLGGEDVNKGFGGQYVYLVPEYTSDRSQAAHAFSLLTTYQEDLCAADMSRGDGKELYRYLCAFYNGSDDSRITKVWLSRTEDTKEGDGRTADLNRNRGGDFLYLCWESEINDDGGNAAPAALSYSKEDDIRGLLGDAGVPIARISRAAADDSEECVIQVPIESILFSQSSISSHFSTTTEAIRGGEFGWGDDIQKIIDTMRGMSIEDRKAIVELFPLMNVVPIPYAGDQHLMSCDNRRLHIFRSVLPPGAIVTVAMAPDAEIKKLKWKWTTRDGLNVKIRAGEKKSSDRGDL